MRQRIAIAVALAAEPRLLVADEPTTALDVTVQAEILRLLDRLCRERGMAVIVITHDLGVMSATARRLCVMYAGRLAEAGPTSELLARPRHPYTRGLLDALPQEGGAALVPIGGSPPSLGRCRPAARSTRAAIRPPVVRDRRPDPERVAEQHLLACPPDPLRADSMSDTAPRAGRCRRGVRRRGQRLRAVDGVDLTVARGEIVGLVGESGCGKSTLARAAVGLEPLAAGAVTFEGQAVTTLGRRRRPEFLRGLQMVFQDPYESLNPRRKVGEIIADGARLGGGSRADGLRQAAELLERVGLPATAAASYPHEFSGGQRQRIAIARTLMTRPSCLIADEPISALDASAQAQIANLLSELVDDADLGLVLVSHDLSVVRQVAHRVAVMYLGRIVEIGETDAVWGNPRHPYTEALVAAIPQVGAGVLPADLPGDVPDPANPPAGCRFHPRCPLAQDSCRELDQRLAPVEGREIACHISIGRGPAPDLWFVNARMIDVLTGERLLTAGPSRPPPTAP